MNSALVNLGSWSTTNLNTSGPVTGAECNLEHYPGGVSRLVGRAYWHRVDLTGKVVDIHLHLVKARRSHGEAQQSVDPDHTAPARGQREGMEQAARANVVGFGALADLAEPNVGVDVERLPRPGCRGTPA